MRILTYGAKANVVFLPLLPTVGPQQFFYQPLRAQIQSVSTLEGNIRSVNMLHGHIKVLKSKGRVRKQRRIGTVRQNRVNGRKRR